MPKYVIRRELAYVSDHTTIALESLLANNDIHEICRPLKQQIPVSIEHQRANMAQTHAKLVETLEADVGHEKGVALRKGNIIFHRRKPGQTNSYQTWRRDNPNDMIEAAKILYRILGIDFHLEWLDESNATLIIDRCALAEHYSKLTCEVLSATDEGIMQGLQPNSTMQFKEYMTSGCTKCKADIHFQKKEIKR